MGLMACNSCGHLANHLDVAPNYSAITGIICGPFTAELVVKSGGRWFPVFLIAVAMNFVGAVIYQSHSTSSQII